MILQNVLTRRNDENGHKTNNEKKAKRNEKGGASAMKEIGVEDAEREGIKSPASTSNVGQKKSGKRPRKSLKKLNKKFFKKSSRKARYCQKT